MYYLYHLMKPFIIVIALSIWLFSSCKHTLTWTCEGNCKTGYGTKKWSDGSYEIGNWRDGLQYGNGKQYFGYSTKYSGDVYIGNFDNGYDGYGTYYGKRLSFIHKGYWSHGKPNGYGETIFGKNSDNPGWSYKGNWKNGVKSGFGEVYMGTVGSHAGITYKGNWVNNEREGTGIYVFPDSSKYLGQFSKNMFEGEAIFIFNDGMALKGTWHKGYSPFVNQFIEKHRNRYPILFKFFSRRDQ